MAWRRPCMLLRAWRRGSRSLRQGSSGKDDGSAGGSAGVGIAVSCLLPPRIVIHDSPWIARLGEHQAMSLLQRDCDQKPERIAVVGEGVPAAVWNFQAGIEESPSVASMFVVEPAVRGVGPAAVG